MARPGTPNGWTQRHEVALDEWPHGLQIALPEGATFYSTPGHGYLRVDTRLLEAKVSAYDFRDGPHHVLLEEDISLPIWLAGQGLIPMDPWIEKWAAGIEFE